MRAGLPLRGRIRRGRIGSRRPLEALLWCSALFLAACSLGPRYHKPDIATADHWLTASDTATPEWPTAEWWRGFNSAELDAFIAQAESANDDLKAAIARVEEADAQRRVALAPLLPGVDASATATRARQPVPGGSGYLTGNNFNPLLTASYELDFWGRNRAGYVAAAASERASRFDRTTVELTVLAGVATTYFQVLELRDRLGVAERNRANAQEALRGLTLEQRAGISNALDVAQQQTVVDTVNASIPPIRQQLRRSQDALAILIGSTPEAVDLTSGTLEGLGEPAVRPGLPSELLTRRPDVAAAEAQLIAANANIAAARAAFFPSISLTAGAGFESPALTDLLTPANRVWSLAGSLTQP